MQASQWAPRNHQQYPQAPQVQYHPPQVQYQPQQVQYMPHHQVQYQPQQVQYQPQQVQYQPQQAPHQQQYYGQVQQGYGQQQPPVQSAGQPQLDPKVHQQYMSFLHHATAAQFKPVKLYVLFNDPTSVSCIQMVRGNSDLDRQVEVIDAAPPGNRPKWLKGVPSLMDDKAQFYLGSECVMWIRYQASQSLAGINETTGTAQMMAGAPAAIDGAAGMTGSLGMTSFVPQQLVADQDLMQTIDGNKAAQRFDQFITNRQQMPSIAPPPGQPGAGQMQLPEQYRTQQVGRGGSAEQLNKMMEDIQNDRSRLLSQRNVPHHHQQQKMGWNPIQTQKIERTSQSDQMNQQLALLEQQRQALQVPMRQF